MNSKLRIAFVWQGISNPKIFNRWQDGLRKAMELIAQEHNVSFYEPSDNIEGEDIILYWEAPVTIQHPVNGVYYQKVMFNDIPKILLFAGGQIRKEWVNGFNLLLVESKINEKECAELSIPYQHAFGVNNIDFKYIDGVKKIYDGMLHGTCASWKRQWLIGEALGPKGMVCGRYQENDPKPFDNCKKFGTQVLPEMLPQALAFEINSSHTLINSSEYWGGGQRSTLEAMACGVPVIVMSDSPKNIEFVAESNFGEIIEPNAEAILKAVEKLKANPLDPNIGINYVQKNFSVEVYKNQILEAINKIL